MPISDRVPTLQELQAFRERHCRPDGRKVDVQKAGGVPIAVKDSSGRVIGHTTGEPLTPSEVRREAERSDPNAALDPFFPAAVPVQSVALVTKSAGDEDPDDEIFRRHFPGC